MKTVLFAMALLAAPLAPGADAPNTEANAVIRPIPFQGRVTALTTSGFTSVAPNGAREKNIITPRTQVKQGEHSAVFGDIHVGDMVYGDRLPRENGREWEVLKIDRFVPRSADKGR